VYFAYAGFLSAFPLCGAGLALQPCQYTALLIENAEKLPELQGKVQANVSDMGV
jgi:hypothetical protein